MTAVHVYIGSTSTKYYIYYSKGVRDAVDKSDCYGANLIDILKFQIQIFYICQKIYVILLSISILLIVTILILDFIQYI